MDFPSIFAALEDGYFDGWYVLEVFASESYPDSLLQLDPAEMVRRGKAGFEAAWAARRS
jgi:sugar phosphate isomerase/epimerase